MNETKNTDGQVARAIMSALDEPGCRVVCGARWIEKQGEAFAVFDNPSAEVIELYRGPDFARACAVLTDGPEGR